MVSRARSGERLCQIPMLSATGTDDAYARGFTRAEQAATQDSGPVIDELDLLVVR